MCHFKTFVVRYLYRFDFSIFTAEKKSLYIKLNGKVFAMEPDCLVFIYIIYAIALMKAPTRKFISLNSQNY